MSYTLQPTQKITLPPQVKRRRPVVRRRVVRPVAPTSAETPELTPNQRLAAVFKDAKPDPIWNNIRANIKAAEDAERQKALDEGMPWE